MFTNDTNEFLSCDWNDIIILGDVYVLLMDRCPLLPFSLGGFFIFCFNGLDFLLIYVYFRVPYLSHFFCFCFQNLFLSFLQGPISLCSVSHFLCLTHLLLPLSMYSVIDGTWLQKKIKFQSSQQVERWPANIWTKKGRKFIFLCWIFCTARDTAYLETAQETL